MHEMHCIMAGKRIVSDSLGERSKEVLKNLAKFTGKHLCRSLFLNKVAGLRSVTLLKKETPIQVFSYEFFEIFKNTCFIEHL